LHSGTEGLHGVPRVVDVEDGVVVVFKVVAMDWDVAGANEAGTAISELCYLLVTFLMELQKMIDIPW
jgi:hypothetical protein